MGNYQLVAGRGLGPDARQLPCYDSGRPQTVAADRVEKGGTTPVSMNDPDYPHLVEVTSHIPPENISVFSVIKSIDLSAPAGGSIHQDLGRIPVSYTHLTLPTTPYV